jgi:hypothetical protein
MKTEKPSKPVERLFPFVLRAAILIVGREALARRRKKLQFILVTTDLSANSRAAVLRDFAGVPMVEHYIAADLERWFGLRNTKVLGFRKSALANSVFRELKEFRIGTPTMNLKPPESAAGGPPPTSGAM